MGGFYQWHMVVICIWCSLFVTSQFDIFMFPNQQFGEICWHNIHIIPPALPSKLRVMALNINYQRSRLGYRNKMHSRLRHSSS